MKIAGARVFVRVVGSGPPVLLINGLGASHAMWEPVAQGLEGCEVITFDAPGVGKSGPSITPTSVPGLARLVRELLAQLDRERVDVLGYSFGGAIAQELARSAPDSVRRLVLAGSTCGWGGVPGTPAALAVLSMPVRYYSRPFYVATARHLAGGQAERDPEFVRRAAEARLRFPPSLSGYFGQLSAAAQWSSWRWLHKIQQPTLVVHGDEDPVSPPANGSLLAHRIPNARLRLQAREGHFLLLDAASSSIPAISEFLSAETHTTSATWHDAADVDKASVVEALDATAHATQPLAAFNAMLRASVPTS
jgi:pimeloyl-ACP methyl ester carboxylesterase